MWQDKIIDALGTGALVVTVFSFVLEEYVVTAIAAVVALMCFHHRAKHGRS
jgi:hypothetical protein